MADGNADVIVGDEAEDYYGDDSCFGVYGETIVNLGVHVCRNQIVSRCYFMVRRPSLKWLLLVTLF